MKTENQKPTNTPLRRTGAKVRQRNTRKTVGEVRPVPSPQPRKGTPKDTSQPINRRATKKLKKNREKSAKAAFTKRFSHRHRTIKTLKLIGGACFICLMLLCLFVYGKVEPMIDEVEQRSYEFMSSISDGTFRKKADTVVYASDSSLLGKISAGNYKYAKISDISPYITGGYIAVEDRDFYQHTGISPKAMLRAATALVRNNGEVTQGGSTITQQVLKNNLLNELDNRWERKIIEVYLAPQFEKKYSKSEIMEFYCNTNFYANNCYGVEMASRFYFGKSAKSVTPAEAAVIIGLSNNPARYNPVKHPEECLAKRHRVLEDMLETGVITQEEFNTADNAELNLVLYKEASVKESYAVSFAVYCAALKQMELNGFEFKYTFDTKEEYDTYTDTYDNEFSKVSADIRSGGYAIHTSINKEQQNKLQSIVDYEMRGYRGKAEDGRYLMQASATVVDNATGYVTAIVGGRGTDDEYNRAYQGYRQPGSCAKPIVAYGPGFDSGSYYPSKLIKDEKEKDTPSNWDGIYRGRVSARESLERSINVTAFNVLKSLRPRNVMPYLAKMRFMGLSYLDTDNGSLAVGGFTYGTTTYEMAKAYSTIANNGCYSDRSCITELRQGEAVLYAGTQHIEQVYSEDTAYMLIDCLKGVLNKSYATGTAGKIDGVIAFGKTGTTNDNKDGWFCGASVPYTISVWAGYDTPKPVDDMGGGKYPLAIYKSMMSWLMQGKPEQDFERPSTIIEGNVDSNGDKTNKTTGKTDLFSGVALKEASVRAKAEKERKAEAENKRIQEEQDLETASIKESIARYSEQKFSSISDIEASDYLYNSIESRINQLFDIKAKAELREELSKASAEIEKDASVYRKKYELAVEQEKEEAKTAAIKDKESRLAQAKEAILKLENWSNDANADTKTLLNTAKEALNLCKDFNEYTGLKSRYDTCNTAIKAKEAEEKSEKERAERERKAAEAQAKLAEDKRLKAEAEQKALLEQERLAEIEANMPTVTTETTTETTTAAAVKEAKNGKVWH